jgi:hypothetical protein
MTRVFISRENSAELKRLSEELTKAIAKAALALRTKPPEHQLVGETLRKFTATDAEVAAIFDRIRKIP